jgi:hypothetical protein
VAKLPAPGATLFNIAVAGFRNTIGTMARACFPVAFGEQDRDNTRRSSGNRAADRGQHEPRVVAS